MQAITFTTKLNTAADTGGHSAMIHTICATKLTISLPEAKKLLINFKVILHDMSKIEILFDKATYSNLCRGITTGLTDPAMRGGELCSWCLQVVGRLKMQDWKMTDHVN